MKYKNQTCIFEENKVGEVLYLTYPLLEKTEIVKHGFSTRIGGVSEGMWSSMNLSFSRGDDESCVRENFKRMAKALDVSEKYGVSIAYSDIKDLSAGYHLRYLYTGDDVEIPE